MSKNIHTFRAENKDPEYLSSVRERVFEQIYWISFLEDLNTAVLNNNAVEH